jgi:AAA family ATP:ADP antiporter
VRTQVKNRALWSQIAVSALLVASLVAGKATRDALFLARFGADALPRAMAVASILALMSAFVAAALMRRFGPLRSTNILVLTSAALLAGEAATYHAVPELVVPLLYIQVGALGAATLSGFWASVTEHFDAHAARAAVARIAAAAPVGGLLGGLGAAPLLEIFGAPGLLATLAALHVLAALLQSTLPEGDSSVDVSSGSGHGLGELGRSSYLRRLAMMVAATALLATLIDYAFKARAAAAFHDTAQLLSFFGIFYTVVSVLSAAVQFAFTRQVLMQVGLGGTLAFLPGFAMAGAALALVAPELIVLVLLRGGANVLENTAFRSAYEPLYTPISPAKKRAVKTIIDVGAERLGDTLGAGFVIAALALLPAGATQAALIAAVVAGALALGLSMSAHRGYVAELAHSLRSGVVELSEADVIDRTTKLTLSQTAVEMDRDTLLRQIEKIRVDLAKNEPALAELGAPASRRGKALDRETPVASLEALLSQDPERVSGVLKAGFDERLLPFVVPLLGNDALAKECSDALCSVASRHVGALADYLLSRQVSLSVRRRLPRVLQGVDDERAQSALSLALDDEEIEVRYRSALALRSSFEQFGGNVPRSRLIEAARKELALARSSAKPWFDRVRGADLGGASHSLKYVFGLLSLIADRESTELALTALLRGNQKLKGTALEYLDNVLPSPLREELLLELGVRQEPSRAVQRPREVLVDELKRSLDGVPLAEVTGSLTPPAD